MHDGPPNLLTVNRLVDPGPGSNAYAPLAGTMNAGEIHTRPERWPRRRRDDKMTRPNSPMRRLNSVPCAPLGLNSDNQCIETRWGLD